MSVKLMVFSAGFCSQCGPYKKNLTEAGIEFEVVDADDDDKQDLFAEYGVRGLPTSVFLKDGVVVEKLVGNKPVKEIQAIMEGLK